MKIIAIEKELPGASSKGFEKFSKDESLKAYELYKKGIIRELYFREDKNEAILILECKDIIEAKKYLRNLPFVKEKLIDFELIPLKPYPGFERLFA